MGFRNDEDARIHRIDALEGELDEKDAEIARLKAELEAKEVDGDLAELERMEAAEREQAAGRARQQAPRAPSKSAPSKTKDTREVWAFDTHKPNAWMIGVGWFVVVAAGAWYMHAMRGMEWATLWPALVILPMGFMFLHRHGLVLDKRAGTVTRTDRLLFLSFRRERPYAGKAITVARRYYSSDTGDGHYNGHVFLGDLKLFAKREAEADRLAKQIAEFLGIPVRPPSARKMQQRAMLPLVLTAVGVVLFLVVFFLREHLLR
jgi:hypothetical protein